jgi:phosphate starvation-inducible protein PhoH
LNREQAELLGYIEPVVPARRRKSDRPKSQTSKFENLSLKPIKPLTEGQRIFFRSFLENSNIIAEGAAGTGKTFIATYLALDMLLKGKAERIIFVRSIVAARDIGFLPGTIWEKSEPYWSLYKDHVNELCSNGTAWDILFKKGFIEFETTSFLRGKTWNNSVVIIDEVQNCTRHELYSALTRIGNNSSVIICGDHKQTDLNKRGDVSGWDYLKKLANLTTDIFDVITFTNNDIVRSEFVKKVIIADSQIQ